MFDTPWNDFCNGTILTAARLDIHKEGFGFGHDGQYLPTIIGIGMIYICITIICVSIYLNKKYIHIGAIPRFWSYVIGIW